MQEQGSPGTPKEIMRSMMVFSLTIILGTVVFAGVMVMVHFTSGPVMDGQEPFFKEIISYVAAGIGFFSCMAAIRIFKKMKSSGYSQVALTGRLTRYRSTLIAYLAACEGAALFAIIAFFMTGIFWLLIIAALMLGVMMLKLPLRKKIIADLELDWKEQQELE
jgi:hypothetical protein